MGEVFAEAPVDAGPERGMAGDVFARNVEFVGVERALPDRD
ncbi:MULTISPECIES: hypothetical protein [Mycobacterium avium complex (MAC)]|nr:MULTISPECIES: hypothetical protein [Mycobacterium avium complex (MAC)]